MSMSASAVSRELIGPRRLRMDAEAAAGLVRQGDVVEVKVGKVDGAAARFAADLDQLPQVEGAVVALDNRTGQMLAMVGGVSFERSQFNRATQAMRQVGLAVQAVRLHRRDRSRVHGAIPARRFAGEFPGRTQSAAVRTAKLRPRVPRSRDDPHRAGTIAQRADDSPDGGAGPEGGDRVRPAAGHHVAAARIPVGRDRRRRRHAARDDVGLLGLSQPGRPHAAAADCSRSSTAMGASSSSIAPNRTKPCGPTRPTS